MAQRADGGPGRSANLVSVPADAYGPIVYVLLWFPPGYLLLTALFAMAGAVVSRVEELQNSTMAVQTVFMSAT